MKIIVAKLEPGDMADIAAYVASKFPPDPVASEASITQ
jgi:cytochrome c553